MAQKIDPNQLSFQWRNYVNSPDRLSNTYSVRFDLNGQPYTFIPSSVIDSGVRSSDGTTSAFKYFLDENNLRNLSSNATPVDLSGVSWYGDWLKNNVGASPTGYLVPGDVDLGAPTVYDTKTIGDITGIKKSNGNLVYSTTAPGSDYGYIDNSGTAHNVSQGSSILGKLTGGLADDWGISGALSDVADPINQFFQSDIGKAILLASAASNISNAATPEATAQTAGETGAQDIAAYNPPQFGPGVQVASNEAGAGLNEAAAAANAANAGNAAQGLQMPQAANLADMGGGQGIAGGTTLSNLADMGGAQGLTSAGAGLASGELLGANGVGGAITPATAGIGTGLGLSNAATSAGSALTGAAAANALTGATAGSSLADILPYTTAASLAGGYLQSQASKEAAQIQADAAAKALAQQQANFDLINKQQAPYRGAGYGALNQLAKLGSGQTQTYDEQGNPVGPVTGASDYLTHQFNAADLAAGLAPNYDFMLQQGQMANQRAANAAGGGLSGNALQGLNKFTQDYAGNAYQNAFNNYQNQRTNIYNTLAGIAGIGQTGQNAANTAGTNLANASSQLGVGSAAAQAAGRVGTSNAYSNAINNAANNYTLSAILNQRGNVAMPTA